MSCYQWCVSDADVPWPLQAALREAKQKLEELKAALRERNKVQLASCPGTRHFSSL